MASTTVWKSIAAGAAGACALTLLHEATRRVVPHAPRMDIMGMRGIAATMRAAGQTPPSKWHGTALVTDLVFNTAYYSAVGAAGRDNALLTGSLLGLGAGIGAVVLPQPLGLGVGPSDRTRATQAMTVGLYTRGGLFAAVAYRAFDE